MKTSEEIVSNFDSIVEALDYDTETTLESIEITTLSKRVHDRGDVWIVLHQIELSCYFSARQHQNTSPVEEHCDHYKKQWKEALMNF